jgi:hypothetical protein
MEQNLESGMDQIYEKNRKNVMNILEEKDCIKKEVRFQADRQMDKQMLL